MRVAVVLLVVALAPLATAQQPVTTVVRGRVLADDNIGTVLRGARVAVAGEQTAVPVFTDNEGRFTIGAAAGARLKVSKAGYAPALVDVAIAADMEVRLARGATLSGIVIDELGFGVGEAAVRATRLDPPAGVGAADLVSFITETDEQGNYRLGGLPAGRYSINSERAMPRVTVMVEGPEGHLMQMRLDMLRRDLRTRLVPMSDALTMEMRAGEEQAATLLHKARAVSPPDAPIGGFVTGVILDSFGEPLEGVNLRLRRVRYVDDRATAQLAGPLIARTDDRGQFRLVYVPPGRYVLEATSDDAGFAPVFYPGVTSIAEAVPFVIGRSQEVGGLNVSFVRTRESRVFGFAISETGGPLRGTVSLTSSQRSGGIALPMRLVSTDESGVFEFLNVPPGEYVVRVGSGPRQAPTGFASQFVKVDGSELAPITIAAAATATVAGRVVLEGASAGVSPRNFSLALVPDGDQGAEPTTFTMTPDQDGAFLARGLAGQLRFVLANAPAGWWLKSVDVGGVNAAETPVRFGARDDQRTDIDVVVSADGAAVAGRVTGDRGEPLDDYRVVVFAADRARWFARSPFIRLAAGPEADGGFTMRGVPPGDYLIAAVDTLDGDASSGEWQNPDFLDMLRARAERLSLDEGERASVNLRVIRMAR